MYYLPDLYKVCSGAVPGINIIQYAPIHYFEEYIINPMPNLRNRFGPIFKEDLFWLEAPFTRQKNKGESNYAEMQTIHNNVYNINIPATLPFRDDGIESILVAMAQMRYIVRVWDYNGNLQVFGSLEQPLTFTFDKKSGSDFKTFTGYNIQFVGAQSTPPFFQV